VGTKHSGQAKNWATKTVEGGDKVHRLAGPGVKKGTLVLKQGCGNSSYQTQGKEGREHNLWKVGTTAGNQGGGEKWVGKYKSMGTLDGRGGEGGGNMGSTSEKKR